MPGRSWRTDRLRHSREFQHVAKHGRRVAGPSFVVLAAPAPGAVEAAPARLGITVSRKVGNAVVRNRVKRRVREWFRRHRGELRPGTDLVVIGRAAATTLSTSEVDAVLCDAASRAQVVIS